MLNSFFSLGPPSQTINSPSQAEPQPRSLPIIIDYFRPWCDSVRHCKRTDDGSYKAALLLCPAPTHKHTCNFITPRTKVQPSINRFSQNWKMLHTLCEDLLYRMSHSLDNKCGKVCIESYLWPWAERFSLCEFSLHSSSLNVILCTVV